MREVEQILAEHGATRGPEPDSDSLVHLRLLTVDLPELQEVNTEAIAKDKVLLASQLAGGPCLVEAISSKPQNSGVTDGDREKEKETS